MFELFNRRKIIREILKQFAYDQWEDIIPIIVEIGILYMKQSYPSMLDMSVEDYKMILFDMKSKIIDQSNIVISNLIDKKIKTKDNQTNNNQPIIITKSKERKIRRIKRNDADNNISHKPSKNLVIENKEIARKPSEEWRKGDRIVYKKENSPDIRRIADSNGYRKSLEKNQTDKSLSRSPLNINPYVYPQWWGDPLSEDECGRSRTKSKEDYRLSRAEVYIIENKPILNNYLKRNISKSHGNKSKTQKIIKTENFGKIFSKSPRDNINKAKIIQADIPRNKYKHADNKSDNNLNFVESKIKSMVEYDKLIHNQIKKQNKNLTRTRKDFHIFEDNKDDNAEWNYKENNFRASFRDRSEDDKNFQRSNISNADSSKKRINYLISYDKNFKPEMIREKSHEKLMNKKITQINSGRKIAEPKKISSTNNSLIDRENKSEEILYEPQTAKFNEEETKMRNEHNEFIKSKISRLEKDKKSELSKDIINASFKKTNSNRLENDKEILSSYAPSERTQSKQIYITSPFYLDIFQRDYSKKYTDYLNSKSKNTEGDHNLNRNDDSLLTTNSIYQ